MTNLEKIKQILIKSNSKYKLTVEATDSLDLDEQIKAKGMRYDEGLSTLIYRVDEAYLIVFLRRDDRFLDMKKLKKNLGAKKVEYATESDLKELGFMEGLVSPAIIPDGTKVFVDTKVKEMKVIITGAAATSHYLEIDKDDLLKLLPKYEYIDTKPNPKRQDASKMNRVLSGITPSGKGFHIGNYFGAVQGHIQMQDEIPETYFFIADLHALTTVKDKQDLEENIMSIILDYLALGMDPNKAVFYRQSDVPANSQLAIVLANYISYGQMQRMHAFKDKLEKGADTGAINMGLFNYPILMAADILAYKPDGVPVGEDQRQHVELTRDIAENFNRAYGQEILKLPKPLIKEKEVARVVGTDGERKMSKSIGNTIEVFADAEVIKKQIMGSYTDPNRIKATDLGTVEGNPIFIYHDLINDDKNEVNDLKQRYRAGKVGDVEVKEKLINAHSRLFSEARERRKELESNLDEVKDIMNEGAKKASKVANTMLEEVYDVVGL